MKIVVASCCVLFSFQVYMPTTEAEDVEVLTVYAKLQKVIDECPKKDQLVVMGDFNAQIGVNQQHVSCGKFGLGERNDRGQLLLDWLGDNKLGWLLTPASNIDPNSFSLGAHLEAGGRIRLISLPFT